MLDKAAEPDYVRFFNNCLTGLDSAASKSESRAVRNALRQEVTNVGVSIMQATTPVDLFKILRDLEVRLLDNPNIRRYACVAQYARERMMGFKIARLHNQDLPDSE